MWFLKFHTFHLHLIICDYMALYVSDLVESLKQVCMSYLSTHQFYYKNPFLLPFLRTNYMYCIALQKLAHAIHRDFFAEAKIDIFNIFAQIKHCGYALESPQPSRLGGSNKYTQCMFWIKNKKIWYTPANPSFSVYEWRLRGYTFHGHIFLIE